MRSYECETNSAGRILIEKSSPLSQKIWNPKGRRIEAVDDVHRAAADQIIHRLLRRGVAAETFVPVQGMEAPILLGNVKRAHRSLVNVKFSHKSVSVSCCEKRAVTFGLFTGCIWLLGRLP